MKGGIVNCPYCNSPNTIKRGFLDSGKQRYVCDKCGKYFSEYSDVSEFPAVLFIDIETLPLVGYMWSPWEADIRPEQLIKDWCVLSWAAKWLDDERMIYDLLTPKEAKVRDDTRIVHKLWKLFDDADIIIAQNGKKFDVAKMNTRFWKYQLPHYSSFKLIDTLDAARRTFGMTYNGLDYLAEYLGAGKKIKTEFGLWVDCDHGDPAALAQMSIYNQGDVTLLENVYMKMRAWISGHPKFTAYDKIIGVCPVCMDSNINRIGLYTANVRQYAEYRCKKCGSVWHSTKPEK